MTPLHFAIGDRILLTTFDSHSIEVTVTHWYADDPMHYRMSADDDSIYGDTGERMRRIPT